jgi:hypothetical protein
VWVPEPSTFVLHKLLISPKRKNPGKKEKDLMADQSIGELCLQYNHHRKRLGSPKLVVLNQISFLVTCWFNGI